MSTITRTIISSTQTLLGLSSQLGRLVATTAGTVAVRERIHSHDGVSVIGSTAIDFSLSQPDDKGFERVATARHFRYLTGVDAD